MHYTPTEPQCCSVCMQENTVDQLTTDIFKKSLLDVQVQEKVWEWIMKFVVNSMSQNKFMITHPE